MCSGQKCEMLVIRFDNYLDQRFSKICDFARDKLQLPFSKLQLLILDDYRSPECFGPAKAKLHV